MKKEKSVAPLNPLESINIEDVRIGTHYFVVSEENDGFWEAKDSSTQIFKGMGISVFEFLKEMYNYEEWEAEYIEDNETSPTFAEFLSWVSEVNGDGYSYTRIYEM